ncbi:MAG: gamma-glutamyltransferase [Alphaproteobacteria bacterium]|nr:gamma-glutamyltransferase [Alphaproteobacteria bacterium]
MISSANPLASAAGREILRAGGSAVDAAIAAQAVLTLVEPQSSGIGGGAFLMHFRKSDGRVEAFDGRETAPAAIRPDVFVTADGKRRSFRDISTGGAAVGVPGILRMLALAHKEHGKLPWARLFERAISHSENGFPISPRLHAMIRRAKDLQNFPAARAYFLTPEGTAKAVGTLLRNPLLADTYRRLAAGGAEAFYSGDIARDISAAVANAARNPAMMTLGDIAGYQPKIRKPICRPYRTWRLCAMPPPTSGGLTTLQILGLLEGFDMARIPPSSVQAVHLISEASRLAYADRRRYIGDPDFVTVPVDGMLDSAYLRRRAEQISGIGSMGKASPGRPRGAEKAQLADDEREGFPSTSHLSVIDRDGNAVSMTTTIERAFGSRLMVRGFLLNNQLTDFAFIPRRDGRRVANAVAPGKRPRSSMSPTLVFNAEGNLFATVGSPGGSRIITYVIKALIGLMDWKLDMQAAIDLPNHANRNGATELEKNTPVAKHADALRKLGHNVKIGSLVSGLHGIRVTRDAFGDGYDGGADRRREGVALGD